MNKCQPAPRLLIIPGLHDSDAGHWQTWLQAQFKSAKRVVQRDFHTPALERWAERIHSTLNHSDGEWIAVAHSFGCLALARYIADHPEHRLRQALFVAPAEPDNFGLAASLPQHRLGLPASLIASSTDPWMSASSAARWAHRWGANFTNLGDVGHINTEAGFGPFPLAKRWVDAALARAALEQHATDAQPALTA